MKIKNLCAGFALLAYGSLSAQNATKTDLNSLANQVNALSAKVAQLENNLERVMTENVNLVEQLNIKTVTSVTDINNIQWDIVKVHVDSASNDVMVTLRVTNHANKKHDADMGFDLGTAVDSDSNLTNNVYVIKGANQNAYLGELEPNLPVNIQGIIKGVPTTSSYLSLIRIEYLGRVNKTQKAEVKFTGVHIPR